MDNQDRHGLTCGPHQLSDHQLVDIEQFIRSGAIVRVPCGPGIGVEIDDTMLDNLAIRRLTLKSPHSQAIT